jgi:hypothetical protein
MRIFTFILMSLFIGCGGSDNGGSDDATTFTFGSKDYVIVEQSTLTTKDTAIEGSGSLIAKDPLAAVASGNHFHLVGTLKDSSTLTLSANGTESNASGIQLKFMNEANALKVSMEFGGKSVDLTDKFAGKDASSISYHFDIHNDETPAHILIWDGSVTDFSEETALFNSEDGPAAPGNGTGAFWGVILNDSKVTKLAVGDAEFEEE